MERAFVRVLPKEDGLHLWLTPRARLVHYCLRFGDVEPKARVYKPGEFLQVRRLLYMLDLMASKDEFLAVMLRKGKNQIQGLGQCRWKPVRTSWFKRSVRKHGKLIEVTNLHIPNGTGPGATAVLSGTFEGHLIAVVKLDVYRRGC